LNRVDAGSWYGASIKDVVLKPWQFSCWNANDPNRKVIEGLTAQQLAANGSLGIARQLIAGILPDITGGATHYHAKSIKPSWAAKMQRTVTIGNHIFYKEV
jgi:spore germination cell wall hydrolase CwlJ-like protein